MAKKTIYITEAQKKKIFEQEQFMLSEDKNTDYLKKLIKTYSSEMIKPYLETKVSELPNEYKNHFQQADNRLFDSCVRNNANLLMFLRLQFLKHFDISHGKGPVEFIPGLGRIGIAELGFFNEHANQSDISLLKQLVLFIHTNKDLFDTEINSDLNGWDFSQLKEHVNQKRKEFNLKSREKLSNAYNQGQSHYTVVPINSQEEARKYAPYTTWCVTDNAYSSYAQGGARFYFCLRDDFENVKKEAGEGCPLDEYGLSMVSILVDMEGEPTYVTTRWNHQYDGENNENFRTAEQVQNILGINFYQTFKPYTREELHEMGIVLFDEVQGLLDSGKKPKEIFDRVYILRDGFARVELNRKYNFINAEGKLISDTWFEVVWAFNYGFAKVRLNGKYNFINTEGKLISDTWFDDAWEFFSGLAQVKLNNKWNIINTEGKFVNDKWLDWIGNFHYGFAAVRLNGKYNYIDTEGKLISDTWFDRVLPFFGGLATVKLNGKYNYIDTEGNLYDSTEKLVKKATIQEGHKTLYITEAQLSEIKKKHKKKSKPSAMDQVHNKVNSGIMANITCGGMFEGKEEVITLYHGVNPDKLEHNLQIGGFEPRVCSEGGPKAIWLSEKQYGYPFIFKFQIPKKMVSQMTAVDYIYEDVIPFNGFNCELVKTQIFLHVHNSVVEVNLMDERLSKLQFMYFPDLKNFLTKEFENYPLVFETYIKSFIEKYDSAPIDESLVLENSNDKMVNAYIKQLFGIDDFQEVRNKVMDAYKKVPMARSYGDKFLLGVLRYIYEEKIQPKEYPILNYMISQMPYSFRNSFDGNFNGIPYAELKEKLFPKYAETVEPKTDCPKVRQTKNGYIIRRIDSFTEMHYYDAGGNWCIGNQEDMWYELIQYETVYIVENPSLVKKVDAERDKYEEKWDEASEYDEPGIDFPRQFRDEYALSRFVVISSEKGIFEVYSRYNIPNCHDGSFLSDKELEKLLGIPVREAFPYIPSEEKVETENLNEGIYDIEDLTNDENLYDCTSILEEFLDDKKRGIKVKQWNLIPAEQYQNLLRRYMTSPEMARIPYEVVLRWFKDIIVPNAFAINNITMLAGHSSYFPFDEVYDAFNIEDGNYEYHTVSKILEDAGFYDWCKLPDGSDGWSDYGLEPLMKIVMEYRANMSADDILILINRCLDVAHQRGDLASAFIEGGKSTCSKISNSLNENPNLEEEAEKETNEGAEPEADEYHIAGEGGNNEYFHALNESRDAFIFQGKKYTYQNEDVVTFISMKDNNNKVFVADGNERHEALLSRLMDSGVFGENPNPRLPLGNFHNGFACGCYWKSINLIALFKTPTNRAESENLYNVVEALNEKGLNVNKATLIINYWDNSATRDMFIPYPWFFNGIFETIKDSLISVEPVDESRKYFKVNGKKGTYYTNWTGTEYYTYYELQDKIAKPSINEYNNKAANVLRESISSEGYNFKKDIKSILKFMRSEGLKVYPFPKIKLNWEDQDGLFIRTGYYEPTEKRVVVFCKDRHPKDILRSVCHELIHHVQNLEGKDLNFTSNDDVKDNKRLEKIEAEAYLKGNIYFRKWTEYQHGKEMLQEARKKLVKNDEGKTVPEKCDKCGGDVVVQIHGEPVYICKDCGKYFGTMPFPNNLNENIIDEISPEEVDLSSFNIKKHLNPKFWKDGKLDSRIRLKLLDISDDFIDTLGVSWVKPKDVIITGSLSNFNWDKNFSDIDLHVLMDFKEVDEKTEFVKEYFDAKKKIWNEQHEGLNIYGFPVEVYVQDVNEEHASSGVYSLDKNEWIVEPKREKLANAKVNKEYIKEKVAHYVNLIDALEKQFEEAGDDEYKVRKTSERAEKLFKAIKGERTKEFSRGKGEISNGNIVFKCLRRMDYIGILIDIRNKTYNKMASLNQ